MQYANMLKIDATVGSTKLRPMYLNDWSTKANVESDISVIVNPTVNYI
jgi:hypothetical protein